MAALGLVVGVSAGAVGGALGVGLYISRDGSGPAASFGSLIADIIWLVMICGVVGVLVVMVLRRGRPGSVLSGDYPLAGLPRGERRALERALRRGDPIRSDQRDVALRAARHTLDRRRVFWVLPALAVLQGMNAVVQDSAWTRWLFVVLAVLLLIAAVYYAWLVWRLRLAIARLTDDQ